MDACQEVSCLGQALTCTEYLWNLVFFSPQHLVLALSSKPAIQSRRRHPPYGLWLLVSFTQSGLLCIFAVLLGSILARDIQRKMDERAKELLLQIEECARQYALNRCSPETRVPMAEAFCRSMELCMVKDSVYSVQAVAALIGETAEVLLGSMSPMTMAGFVGLGL